MAAYSPEVRGMALAARGLILEVMPDALEQVDPPSKIIAYGHGKKYADLVCALAPFKSSVNLMFSKGTELSDPAGLLEGTGKHARHVKLRTAQDAAAPGVRRLLEQAAEMMRP